MQHDRIRVDRLIIDDILRAAFHVASADARVDARPSADGPLDTVRANDDARANLACLATRTDAHTPSSAVALHARGFDRRADVRAGCASLHRDRWFEPRAIEDEANVALGDSHLGAIRRAKENPCNATRDPRRENTAGRRIEKLSDTGGADAFAAPDRRTDRGVALEYDYGVAAPASCRFSRRDQTRRSAANDENIAIFGAHEASGAVTRP